MLFEDYQDAAEYAVDVLLSEQERKGERDSIWRPGGRSIGSQVKSGLKYGAMIGTPLAVGAAGASAYLSTGNWVNTGGSNIMNTGRMSVNGKPVPDTVRDIRQQKFRDKFTGDTLQGRRLKRNPIHVPALKQYSRPEPVTAGPKITHGPPLDRMARSHTPEMVSSHQHSLRRMRRQGPSPSFLDRQGARAAKGGINTVRQFHIRNVRKRMFPDR